MFFFKRIISIKCSRTKKSITIGSCTIDRLLFAYNLVSLAYSEQGIYRALDCFLCYVRPGGNEE